ncbi:hypothetical protein KP509_10G080500 [Ceratopteris richardii]|uniref:Uncharacterized protein n=1 Tax=Ceratopteris richardii TaxID=49495 RepID=A0A8T2U2S8_CERRI|nr:hypothetical protein KP509_10G080500 [Ceratopteris richardii]
MVEALHTAERERQTEAEREREKKWASFKCMSDVQRIRRSQRPSSSLSNASAPGLLRLTSSCSHPSPSTLSLKRCTE